MSNPLDTKIISRLAEILDKTNLTELEYEDESCRISLVRNVGGIQTQAAYAPVQQVASAPVQVQTASLPTQSAEPASSDVDYTNSPNAVKSPMVGVVYLAPEPGANTFVSVGSAVKTGDTVALVEAMKTFNPIKADKDGVVKEILVTDGAAVEFEQPLIVIE